MNMFDEARAILGMLNMCKATQSDIAKRLGKSQSYVANKIRLLKLPENVKNEIINKGICERQARQLLRLNCEEDMLFAINKIHARSLSVAESEAVVDMLYECEAPKRILAADVRERIESFESFISTSVKSLISLGIMACTRTERHGRKKYITISIEENIIE